METLTFYKRYISEIKSEQSIDGTFPLEGKSPFGDDKIRIEKIGEVERYYCHATGGEGYKEDLLLHSYPLLTQEGIKRALDAESRDDEALRKHICDSRLSAFREDSERLQELEAISGLPPSIAKDYPLWLDQDGRTLHYLWRSEIGHPVSRFSWQHGSRRETIVGVPRIGPCPDAPRVWFVENPLQAKLLQYILEEPVYVRPHDSGLDWIDYERLLQGKTAVLLIGDERGEWEYSFHPFIKCLQDLDTQVKSIHTMPLTKGKLLTKWLMDNPSHKDTLLDTVQRERANQTVAFDKDTYQSFISGDKSEALYFPQHHKGGMFWYGTAEGTVVHSHPFNILEEQEVQDIYNIDASIHEDPGIRLTKADVFNIDRSSRQLTPKNTFDSLKSLILDHIYLEHPQTASLVGLWIMGGYVYKLFNAYGYLHLHGNKGAGKTTFLELITKCGFNGLLESQATRASVIQQVHKLGCTLGLDEFESHSKGTGTEYTHMVNVGYKEGGSYRKMTGKNSTTYNLYSPKALASIDPIEAPALSSRVIPIPMRKMPSRQHLNLWEPDAPEIQQRTEMIRRGCYALGLYHHRGIKKFYRRIPSPIELPSGGSLTGRKRQLVAPLLSMARLVDINRSPQVEDQLLKAVELAWYPKLKENQVREEMLANLLKKWNNDPEFGGYDVKEGLVWIDNKCWIDTELATHTGGKDPLLEWFEKFPGIKKGQKHIPGVGTRGCTAFPEDLTIAGKEFRQWFSR
ncbi:hypothetical protein [Fodinibius sp. AD559]|uniref:hypothetical protein n=1 Tax=Fodinibius sp. AD559 TaxID=3424179 RepID=UPI004046DE33